MLDRLFWQIICLLIIGLFSSLVFPRVLATIRNCKGVMVFFILTGASLPWTKEGRVLAPVLLIKMVSMWLWVVVWINWVGFEQILSTLERLRIPPILFYIASFTARFLPILSQRLRLMLAAQTSRGARKGLSLMSLRNLAGGLGCLLISSFEQSEDVGRAMISRGFCGKFLLHSEEDVGIPYGSLACVFIFACFVWGGIICNALYYPCI